MPRSAERGLFAVFSPERKAPEKANFCRRFFPLAHFVKFNRFSVKALVFLIFRLYNNDE